MQVFKGNSIVKQQLNAIETLQVPVIAVGELLYGAYKSNRLSQHLRETIAFLDYCKILVADSFTADFFGRVKTALMKKGKPIPDNDIWIAAIAIQHELPLFTSDAHFRKVEGLQLFNPLSPA